MTLRDFDGARCLRHKAGMSDFFAMGGYAAYVWPAYGVSAIVIAGLAFAIWRRGRALKKQLTAYEATKASGAGEGVE